MRTLVLGGARSGKSGVAEALITQRATSLSPQNCSSVTYVATARPWPDDQDFAERIEVHRSKRPAEWVTEEDRDLLEVLTDDAATCIIVDDLGTWLTEQFNRCEAWPGQNGSRGEVRRRVDKLVKDIGALPQDREVVIVTPEVGMSVIPESAAGRIFRDELGRLNALVAEKVEEVLLVVAGCTLTLKS